MTRKHTPIQTETNVLVNSGRRCCLCFGLDNDFKEKHGQIAHLDRNPANAAEDNLAWLCLHHHSVFDSATSQHKNYSIAEVKRYRTDLYEAWSKIRRGRAERSLALVELTTTAGGNVLHVASSYNISSIWDHDEGLYAVEFATEFPSDRYIVSPIGKTSRDFTISQPTREGFVIKFNKPQGEYIALKIEDLGDV